MSEITNEKKVIISGTVTKYQMKKVIKKPEDVKERKTMDQVSLKMFSWENQYSLLNMLTTKTNDDLDKTNINTVKKQISSKLNNYKQQDVLKKVYDERKIINLEQVIDKLQES
jgi:flagellar biosynthesis chaperone FliJ